MSVIRVDNVAPSAGGTVKSLVRGVASAWANLNGTGTIALRDSQNVSSVVDNGTGDYTYNFTNIMTAVGFSSSGISGLGGVSAAPFSTRFALSTTSTIRVNCNFASSGTTGAADPDTTSICIHGDLA